MKHQVRSMNNEDLLAYKRLCSICYTYPDNNPAEELPVELLRIRRGVFDDAGNLLSAMMQIPYEVRFCGHTVKMVGIGGVVTDPTARAQGAVRAIFETDLPQMYRDGQVLSALYPFSYRFYGKFGYTWAPFGQHVTIPRASLRDNLQRAEKVVRVLPEMQDQGMRAIYTQYIADKNYAVLRTEEMWTSLRSGTPWETLKHAYVLSIGGEPVAYWIGRMEKRGYTGILHMQDMAWTCNAGMEAIFAMLRGMNEVDEIELECRSGFAPALLCNEAYDVNWKDLCQGMVRVINVERALSLLPAPLTAGSLAIEVQDDQIADNCGKYVMKSDGAALSVIRDEYAQADVCCDIRGLTALVVGRHRFAEAVDLGLVHMRTAGKDCLAEQLFAERRLHLNWHF